MPQIGGKNAKKISSDSKRHFRVVRGDEEGGLYVSSSPSSAAKKAVTKLCTSNKSKQIEFHIREITQGSKKKTYGPYIGYIEKLKDPIELKGRVIRYKPVAKLSGKTGKKMKGGEGNNKETAYSFNNLNSIPGKISNNLQNKSKEIIKESMSDLNKAKQEQNNAAKKKNESIEKQKAQRKKANEARRQANENKQKANNAQVKANNLKKKSLESTGRFKNLQAKNPSIKLNNNAANLGAAANSGATAENSGAAAYTKGLNPEANTFIPKNATANTKRLNSEANTFIPKNAANSANAATSVNAERVAATSPANASKSSVKNIRKLNQSTLNKQKAQLAAFK